MFGLNSYITKYIDNKLSYNIYCFIVTLLSFIFYAIDRQYVLYFVFITATLSLLITNQVRYVLPLIFIFTMTVSASISNIVLTIVLLLIFLVSVIIFFIYNNPKFKIKSQGIITLLLGISTFIPILWYKSVELLHDIYIIVYIFYFVIFILYLFLKSSKEKLLPSLIIASSYIPLLLSLELVFYYITVPNTNFQGGIFLGWAGGNHASMMILLTFPFVMYRLYKEQNKVVPILLFVSSILAIIFGFSRAGYIFFIFELFVFMCYSIYYYKDKLIVKKSINFVKCNYKVISVILCTLFITSTILILQINDIESILNKIFNDNGRFEVYLKGINLFISSPRNFILGRGFVTEYILYEGVFLLFHNTFIQAITTGGIIMLILFIIHFYYKYKFFKNKNNFFCNILLICFIITDLYGLTDSTYFTSYFTVVFTTILVCIESEENLFLEIDNNYNIF